MKITDTPPQINSFFKVTVYLLLSACITIVAYIFIAPTHKKPYFTLLYQQYFQNKQKLKIKHPKTKAAHNDSFQYNYRPLTGLIRKYRTIKQLFFSDTKQFIQQTDSSDKLTQLSDQLEKESKRFQFFLTKLKNSIRYQYLSSKKLRALSHYKKTTEPMLEDIEKLKKAIPLK